MRAMEHGPEGKGTPHACSHTVMLCQCPLPFWALFASSWGPGGLDITHAGSSILVTCSVTVTAWYAVPGKSVATAACQPTHAYFHVASTV